MCVCVCVCVCARTCVRARVRVYVCVCESIDVWMGYVGVLMKARECEQTGYMGERRGRVNYDIYSSFRKIYHDDSKTANIITHYVTPRSLSRMRVKLFVPIRMIPLSRRQ